ncbi:MAG: DUF3987 domain-containing protein [Phycisphaerales bacterium]|nr:DUF3987 domain-containing protein [Phycisphaerales bacterium]
MKKDLTSITSADIDAAMSKARPLSERRKPPTHQPAPSKLGGGFGGSPEPSAPPDWPDPEPLVDDRAPAPFPAHAIFPDAARAFVEAVARAYAVPLDLPALLYFTLAGGCLTYAGNGCRIVRVTPPWSETLNIYSIVALPSGSRKSQTFARMIGPVREYERELVEATRSDVSRATALRDIDANHLDRLKRSGTLSAEEQEEALMLAEKLASEPPPMAPRLLAEDITSERLAGLLSEQGGRIIVASPECDLIGLLRGRYADKGGVNLDPFLKGSSGEPLTVDRQSRHLHVPRPLVSIAMSAQPGALDAMLSDPVLNDRGLNPRFVFAVPASNLGEREMRTPPIPADVEQGYARLMRRALAWDGGMAPGQLREVPLTDKAVTHLDDWWRVNERTMRPDGPLADFTGWASKLPGTVVRLAAITTLMDNPGATEIDHGAVMMATDIGDWARAHALRAFGSAGLDPELSRARRVLGWLIRASARTGLRVFTRREVFQGLKGSTHTTFRRAEDVEEPLRALEARGWLRWLGGEGTTTVELHPRASECHGTKPPKPPER